MARRKLLVEGWRFLPHSFALVNHQHLLALRRQPDLDVRVRDLKRPIESWANISNRLHDAQDEAALRAFPAPEPGFVPDATLRCGYPFDLTPPSSGRLAVICTNEYQMYEPKSWQGPIDGAALAQRGDLTMVVPSRWSAEGMQRIGVPPEKIRVVPHGVDSDTFKPDGADSAAMRQRLGIGEGVIFLHAGAMTVNKGADVLLRAFAELCRQGQNVYLLLKGTDALYRSNARLGATMHGLGPDLQRLIGPRIVYGGTTLSMAEMAALYRSADVYVSPYRAEGFNLPVLEAMASGLPVICTAGGPTEDFVTDDCGAKIASRRVASVLSGGDQGVQLQPDLEHLIGLMSRAATDAAWRAQAGSAGQRQAQRYSWDSTVEQLLAVMF